MGKNKNNYDGIFREIKTTPILTKIKLAQDFVNEKLSYGFNVSEKKYIVNSKKKIIEFSKLKEEGLIAGNKDLYESKFPIKSLERYIEGKIKVNPTKLFSDIVSYLNTYIYLQNEKYYSLIALWIMGTYVFNIFRYFPYLHITADKGSGKTTLLATIEQLCFNGSISSNSSAAVIYREVDVQQPTMLLDEAENLHKNKNEVNMALLDILKSGFSKAGYVKRNIGTGGNYTPKRFSSYCPKILAGISELDDVLTDRVATIIMTKNTNINTKKYVQTNKVVELQNSIIENLYFFGLDFTDEIFNRYSSDDFIKLNSELGDNRMIDIWVPLLIIADIIDKKNNDKSRKYFTEMKELMKGESESRKELNQTENEVVKILSAIYGLVKSENEIVREKDSIAHITNSDLLEHLKNSKIVLESFTISRLTTKLKELFNIDNPKNATVLNTSIREYRIPISKIKQEYESRITL